MISLAEFRKIAARQITEPLMATIKRSRIKPNTLTWIGLAISITAAWTIATNHLVISGFLVLLSGLFDILDGALARLTNQTTRFGALLDSTFDRISEAVLLLGLLVLCIRTGGTLETAGSTCDLILHAERSAPSGEIDAARPFHDRHD